VHRNRQGGGGNGARGAGRAALSFGPRITGTSAPAGVIAAALVFGLVLMTLVYGIGPI
jgi:aquaporin Z